MALTADPTKTDPLEEARAMATVAEKLLTAEEFARMPDPGYPVELVRGRIVSMTPPKPLHGWICNQVAFLITLHLRQVDSCRVFINDTGILTEREPDSLRGADVSFYSYERVPASSSLEEYFDVAPEVVFEVLSPVDRWPKVLARVAEYLEVGVLVVSVVDPKTHSVHVYRPDEPVRVLGADDDWSAPEVFGEFRVPVRQFFG
jgi:Uma2 family endonuclease